MPLTPKVQQYLEALRRQDLLYQASNLKYEYVEYMKNKLWTCSSFPLTPWELSTILPQLSKCLKFEAVRGD